jgi:hypothetical protein
MKKHRVAWAKTEAAEYPAACNNKKILRLDQYRGRWDGLYRFKP